MMDLRGNRTRLIAKLAFSCFLFVAHPELFAQSAPAGNLRSTEPARQMVEVHGAALLIETVRLFEQRKGQPNKQLPPGHRAIGGVIAPVGEHPWQVALLAARVPDDRSAFFCGGSLISARWVITAAHCVDNQTKPEQLAILSNTQDLLSGKARYAVNEVIVHPQWDPRTHANDIALLHLTADSDGKEVGLVNRATERAVLPGKNTVVTGWGRTSQGGAISTKLIKIVVPIVAIDVCNDRLAYSGAISNSMLCAGFPEGGVDSCQGDSGGPMTMMIDSKTTLIGLVSWGEGCAKPNKYGVYTNLAEFADWISASAAK